MAAARREGLRLASGGKACEDVDECAEGSAKCERGCRNLDPRTTGLPYVCSCPDGMAVDPADQYHCIQQARPLALAPRHPPCRAPARPGPRVRPPCKPRPGTARARPRPPPQRGRKGMLPTQHQPPVSPCTCQRRG